MRRSGARAGRISIVLGMVGAVLMPSAAEAASTCTYNASKRMITVSGDASVLIERSGDTITSSVGACTNGAVDATVHNTDIIKVNITFGPGIAFGIDEGNGMLAPGFTNEPGTTDEIEVSIARGATVILLGTPSNDHIRLGQGGINLNAEEVSDDVDVSGFSAIEFISSGQGHDIVSTRGGHGTGSAVEPFVAILGGEGNDKLLGAHILHPGDITPDPGFRYTLDGGPGSDRLEGSSFADELNGGDGDDYIDGGAGLDEMDGEDGINTVAFLLENEQVAVNLPGNSVSHEDYDETSVAGFQHAIGSNKADLLLGEGTANRLEGRGGDDHFDGAGGIDQIFGQGGNDTILGGTEVDQISGQSGDDVVNASDEGESISGGPGTDKITYTADVMDEINLATGQSTGPGGGDTFTSFENATADGPTSIIGNVGPNVLLVVGPASEIRGGGGNDTITTDTGSDTINGQGGNDLINGRGGGDTLRGGGGNDTFMSAPNDDTFLGGTGRDLIDFTRTFGPITVDLRILTPQATGAGSDTFGGIEDLMGTGGTDTFTGNASANRLSGFLGDDLLRGEGGNDTIVGHIGDDDLLGGPGRDTVSYKDATGGVNVNLANTERQDTNFGWDDLKEFENVIGSAFNDILRGTTARNVLSGLGGHDQLFGRGGPDLLLGHAGNDDLYGDAGSDECIGGPGVDTKHSC